ncbi:hypothetical protein [Streptomyces sp. NPDC014734]|uniref:hypothetical protein n=1 Tax=Streptomyces sp. NPDC014734 TaxID=3364886 RepID=UPI0036FEED12
MQRARGALGTATAALLVLAFLAGCGERQDGTGAAAGSGGGAGRAGVPLSVDGLVAVADDVGPDGADRCPLPYDMKKAADAAGLSGRVGTGAPDGDAGTRAATAESGHTAEAGGAFAVNPGALVSCLFHLDDEAVEVHTVATEKPRAESALAPVIMSAGRLSPDSVTSYLERTSAGRPGEPVGTDSGGCATVRLKVVGDGDAALLVTAGDAGRTALTARQVDALARALHAQIA